MAPYKMYVRGEISKEEFRVVQDIANRSRADLMQATKRKAAYEVQYATFHKLLSASQRHLLLNGMMDCVDEVVIDNSRKIMVYWK